MTSQAVFIAATGQNVGKTTICLGLIAALKKHFDSVGFIKPVGQQHVTVQSGQVVDKDAYLFKHHFALESSWENMSPVIIPRGFTRNFLDGQVDENALLNKIVQSYDQVTNAHSFTIVEGTGHVGVGSIIALSNARVAAALNLDMIIIASAGLGSAYDELALNIALCKEHGVNIRGIILNRVKKDKKEMLSQYIPLALKKWNIPLIGLVPYDDLLSQPTIQDFASLFQTELISGRRHHLRHFKSVRLFAGSLEAYLPQMRTSELVITPASRVDIIQATLDKHEQSLKDEGVDYQGGLILTGRQKPSQTIIDKMQHIDIPVLYAPMSSYDATRKIMSFIAKIRLEDKSKIKQAIHLVEKHIDLKTLCGKLPLPSSFSLPKEL